MMRRPKWLGVLLLALLVAAGFAGLAQWQLDNAFQVDEHAVEDTETPVPLTEVDRFGKPISDREAGRVVTTSGEFMPGDFIVVDERPNYGELGSWVTAHFVADTAGADAVKHYAVAVGWAKDHSTAQAAVAKVEQKLTRQLLELTGRFTPTEAPKIPRPHEDPAELKSMVPGQLVNLWETDVTAPVSAGYLVAHFDASVLSGTGLEPIESVKPRDPETVNWLNLFYALEWVLFAGFAVFFWTRLVRDAWEREHEMKLLNAQDPRPEHL